jgi:hypothetical protein
LDLYDLWMNLYGLELFYEKLYLCQYRLGCDVLNYVCHNMKIVYILLYL